MISKELQYIIQRESLIDGELSLTVYKKSCNIYLYGSYFDILVFIVLVPVPWAGIQKRFCLNSQNMMEIFKWRNF